METLSEEFLCPSNLNEFVLAVFEKHAFSCQILRHKN